MKRTIEQTDTPNQLPLDSVRLDEFCRGMGISQELWAKLTEEQYRDQIILREAIRQDFPVHFEVLCKIEETYHAACVFVNSALNSIVECGKLGIIPAGPPAFLTPSPPAAEPPTKKGGEKKKNPPAQNNRDKTIARCVTQADWLNSRDHSREWLSRFSVIGQAVRAMDVLPDFDTYTTIYHCISYSAMEDMRDMLQDEGYLAFGIRDDSNKSEECVRYKVITNEPFRV